MITIFVQIYVYIECATLEAYVQVYSFHSRMVLPFACTNAGNSLKADDKARAAVPQAATLLFASDSTHYSSATGRTPKAKEKQ